MFLPQQQPQEHPQDEEDKVIAFPQEPRAYVTRPASGIKPLTWVIVIVVSLLMWGGIIYGIGALLGLIF